MTSKISTICTAEVEIQLNLETAKVVLGAIKPETDVPTSERSNVKISPIKDGILIRVEARDVVALRAAINSYLRWIHGILDVMKKI